MKFFFQKTLRHFDFLAAAEIEKSRIAITGVSGAGKTTLFKCIAGILKADVEEFTIGDEVISSSRAHHFTPPQKRNFACVFQDACLFPHLTVAENILFSPRAQHLPDDAIEAFAMRKLLKAKPENLSAGEAQRVSILRAIASSPRLLLLDEGTAHLDEGLKQQVFDYLRVFQTQQNVTIIFTSHDQQDVEKFAEARLHFQQGKLQVAL